MSRLQQIRHIDEAIQSIVQVTENRCSLSDHDRNVINESMERLQRLKKKKGKTNREIQQVIDEALEALKDFDTNDGLKK